MPKHVFEQTSPERWECRVCGQVYYRGVGIPEAIRECKHNARLVPWFRNEMWNEAEGLYATGSVWDERMANVLSGLASVLAGITDGHYPNAEDWTKIGPAVSDVLERNWHNAKKGGKAK